VLGYRASLVLSKLPILVQECSNCRGTKPCRFHLGFNLTGCVSFIHFALVILAPDHSIERSLNAGSDKASPGIQVTFKNRGRIRERFGRSSATPNL
jgi:hypothetical protein